MSNTNSEKSEDVQIAVLSGPSGSGKTTIVDRLIETSPVRLVKAVSATTRPPRHGERDGEAYYFLSPEEFQRRRAAGEFVEFAEVHGSGHWYGTLKSELRRAREADAWALLEIDVQGAQRVVEQYPDAVTIFLKAPAEVEFERRLRSRATESEQAIRHRLDTARNELKFADRYRYQVVNDDLDRAVEEISEILLSREAQSHA